MAYLPPTSILLFLLITLISVAEVRAQQKPSIVATKFDNSVSFRTNVCDRQRKVWDGSLELTEALRGLNLTTVITNYRVPDENKYFTLVDDPITGEGIIDPLDPGLFAVVLDEAARRAGFQWRYSFAVASPLSSTEDEGKSWTDILLWGVESFDISMEKWGRSISRVEMGISFPTGWWDSSIVLVEELRKKERVVNLWSFLLPFKPSVWATILGTILFTGLLYWSMEYLDVDADERNLEDRPGHTIFYAALVFVGALEFRPKTHAARILSWSWTFWALIVLSAYTANMASFLVSPQIEVFSISTMEQAIQREASICVQNGGVLSSILTNKYGELDLVPKDTEAEIFLGVKDGSCDVAAHQMNTFRIYEKNIAANPDCSLSSEMRVVQPVPAGMATAIDTGHQYCTSLISHVLDVIMTEMISDGFVETAWKRHLNKVGTIDCIKPPPKGDSFFSEPSFRLGMQDIGGIFILHAVILAGAVGLGIFQFYWFRTSEKSISEVFLIKQAGDTAVRASVKARNSIRNSMNSSTTKKTTPNERASMALESLSIPAPNVLLADDSELLRMYEEESSSDSEGGGNFQEMDKRYSSQSSKMGSSSLRFPLDPVVEAWSDTDPMSGFLSNSDPDIFGDEDSSGSDEDSEKEEGESLPDKKKEVPPWKKEGIAKSQVITVSKTKRLNDFDIQDEVSV